MESDINGGPPPLPGHKFSLGSLHLSPYARLISIDETLAALGRHARGDWGELEKEDWDANDLALKSHLRLVSRFVTRSGVPFWVITEADRSVTTVMLPEEY